MAPPIAKPLIVLTKKCGQSTKFTTTTTKQSKKSLTFFLLNLFRFFSPISHLGQKIFIKSIIRFFSLVFYQIKRFFTKHTEDLSVFLTSISLDQDIFYQSIFYLPHHSLGARSIIHKNLVFLLYLLICWQEIFSLIIQIKYQITLIKYMLNGACA